MKTSYIITISGIVVDYTSKLSNAKHIAQRYHGAVITKLVGPYYGEGYHAYYLKWNGERFSYTKTPND